MRKETKVGLALITVLLSVFCFVLYKRIQGRNREAAQLLAQEQAESPVETTQVTAKPVLDGPPRRSAETSPAASGLMSQAWRRPVGHDNGAAAPQPLGSEARFAQADPPAASQDVPPAVDPFSARSARPVDPIAADPVGTVAEPSTAGNHALSDQQFAAAHRAEESQLANEPLAGDERAPNQQLTDGVPLDGTYAAADRQRMPSDASDPLPQSGVTESYPAPEVARSTLQHRQLDSADEAASPLDPRQAPAYAAAGTYADAQPYRTASPYQDLPARNDAPPYETTMREGEMLREEELQRHAATPRDMPRQHEHDLRSEPTQPRYARQSDDLPRGDTYRDSYADHETVSAANAAHRQDIPDAYREPAYDEPYERPAVRGSLAAARMVAQGRPAAAEEAAEPGTYGAGGRWQPDRNAAAPSAQPGVAAQQPYYENPGAGAARTSQAAAAPRGQYTVQPNDSFWSISRKLYGDGGFFKALAEHNRRKFPQTRNLKVGDVVSAPPAEELRKAYPDLCPKLRQPAPATARTVSSQQRLNAGRVYVVEEGDTLFDIARHELGTPARWVEIFELNADRLSNDFDYIRPGTELVLPADPSRSPEARPRENVTRRPGAPTSR